MTRAIEANFDGIVGPTHNYAGLSRGNVASQRHRGQVSNPRAAALEGLAKMKTVADLGVVQYVLPPHERPDVRALRRLGFAGTDAEVLARAQREEPDALAACASASAMWTANAATVAPGADTGDRKVHVTPANLIAFQHRSLETATTALVLSRVLHDPEHFVHHRPLPATTWFADEGAANHMRLAAHHGAPGVNVFTYGRADHGGGITPRRFLPRQTSAASRAVARLHGLSSDAVVFLRQSPEALDAGVFHNDVAAVSNEQVLLFHERAWQEPDAALKELRRKFERRCGLEPVFVEVRERELALARAVDTYLFNSQLVTLGDGSMCLLYPAECERDAAARRIIEDLPSRAVPVRHLRAVEVRQSMQNGGGPACLRLRVELTPDEHAGVHYGIRLTDELYQRLLEWVGRHYRDRIVPGDLADFSLLEESRTALDELTGILAIGSIYPFQRVAEAGC